MKSFSCVLALQPVGHNLPVDDLPNGLHMVGATIEIVDVVGMFPHVDAQQRRLIIAQRIAGIALFANDQTAILLLSQPCPSRAKERESGLCELLFKGVEAAKIAINQFEQRARGLIVGLGRHELREIKGVVERLAGIVEQRTFGHLGHQLLNALRAPRRVLPLKIRQLLYFELHN